MARAAKIQRALSKLKDASAFAAGGRFSQAEASAAADLQEDVQAALQAGELASLTVAQQQALARSLAAVLSPMATLEQPLATALQALLSSNLPFSHLWACTNALMGGAMLAPALGPSAEVSSALAAGASLLAAAGTPLLDQLAAPAGRQALRRMFHNDPTRVDRTAMLLADSLARISTQVLPSGQASSAAARKALLKGAFAPRRLLPFLSALTGAVLGAADDPADIVELAYPSVSRLLAYVFTDPEHAKLHTALKADRPLAERLLRLLLHCLGAVAAGGEGSVHKPSPSDLLHMFRTNQSAQPCSALH